MVFCPHLQDQCKIQYLFMYLNVTGYDLDPSFNQCRIGPLVPSDKKQTWDLKCHWNIQ